MKTLPRLARHRLRELLRSFSAVLVYGPRQCGKTTLVRHQLRSWRHLDLERGADHAALAADIEGFFAANPDRVVLDEAQRLPDVFPHLRHVLDRSRANGRYVLTGSASPGLLRSVSESLAGRIGLLELTPFLHSELEGALAASRWFWGGLPPIYQRPAGRARRDWLDGYVSLYLERDLPLLGIRLPGERLRLLWTMLTHVHGNLLNASDLGRSLGVSHATVQAHLDVLEGTFMIRRLPPYHANVQKRLTKSPKVYIRDSGLLHFLAGLREPAELDTWPRRGGSFEGMVIEELATLAALRRVRPGIFFWRTQAGGEVDLLLADGQRLLPFEIKLGGAVDPRSLAGLRQCMKDLGLERGWVVNSGTEGYRLSGGISVVPWSDIVSGRFEFPPPA